MAISANLMELEFPEHVESRLHVAGARSRSQPHQGVCGVCVVPASLPAELTPREAGRAAFPHGSCKRGDKHLLEGPGFPGPPEKLRKAKQVHFSHTRFSRAFSFISPWGRRLGAVCSSQYCFM